MPSTIGKRCKGTAFSPVGCVKIDGKCVKCLEIPKKSIIFAGLMNKENIIKAIAGLLVALASALCIAFGVTSCQASRVVTTTQECRQQGDTSITMTTRTVETYTGKKSALSN